LLVFRDNRPVESCTRVGEVKYLNHFLDVACSTALTVHGSYYIKLLYRTYNERKTACTNHRRTAMDYAVLF